MDLGKDLIEDVVHQQHAEIVGRIEEETGSTTSPDDPRLGISFEEIQLISQWDYLHFRLAINKLLDQKVIILLPNGNGLSAAL
ncbi:MAG: hypothetical protein RBG13Loki_2671 [Promethearchaeota archaeon CR_4]|nr:MAG: hypothetical protein RBG13Loki_2671 [Candidatus Lokiarchaeota archaeon CR_4]